MRPDEPGWWYGDGRTVTLAERLLAPVGDVYAAAVERRFRTAVPYRAPLPVICVGNFTAGGTGKTPLTRFLIARLAEKEKAAVCLSRGYGGSLAGPAWVDPEHHTAREVGDEPLLIAQGVRVMVARDRKAGLVAIERAGDVAAVVMDDGLQNPSLAKDLSIAVVDARRGFGNGRVIPAGPLRARLAFQLGLVDCIAVMGADAPDAEPPVFEDLKKRFHGPVLRGAVAPTGDVSWITDGNLLAYAGIADPERFFRMLAGYAPATLTRRTFPDHHAFTEAEAVHLLAEADATGAELVTTEKDLARLAGAAGALADLAARSRTLPIAVTFEERDLLRLTALIDGALKNGYLRG
ncbi:tetraacyldisaccharide 4'-kinase [Hyphomicrobium sp.]|uniref:tetraacyldisaccharide 4'-kinase n=1 Tax=Hyphomicrobium sp. TaxID=82 RepID=UPI0025C47426|nr:tetraacyldisaccharide 4'-kinase [Hyphomicrobium sp.]MCC7251727.1 tetraacyldisaccharide 4'-kinase [Hyphomicrobium sp.]